MTTYNVLIVGAGNIGAMFDTSENEEVLTHAHAFSIVEAFNLVVFIEISRIPHGFLSLGMNTNR